MIEKYIEKLTEYQNYPVRVFLMDFNPNSIDLILSVQEELNQSIGIKRESSKEFTRSKENNQKISGTRKMRHTTITYIEHLKRFRRKYRKKSAIAVIGNGNILFNTWFVAWMNRKVFALEDEPIAARTYSSVIVWKNRKSFPVTIGDVKYRDNKVILLEGKQESDITKRIKFATFGQKLVDNHKKVKIYKIINQFYDLRHLLPGLYYTAPNGRKYVFGLDQLYKDEKKKISAVMKKPVNLEMYINDSGLRIKISANKLREVLNGSDFKEVNNRRDIKREGQYYINPDGETITIKYKPNVYPHCIIGTTDEGTVRCMAITGLSGRAGISVEKASKLAADLNMKDAVLLSNGGDVIMRYFGEMIVKSSEKRRRFRSILILAKNKVKTKNAEITEKDIKIQELY